MEPSKPSNPYDFLNTPPAKIPGYYEEMRHPWLNPVTVAIPWHDAARSLPLSDLSAVWVGARQMAGVHLDRVRLTERAFEWLTGAHQFRRRFEILTGRDWEGSDREGVDRPREVASALEPTLGPDCRFEIVPARFRDWDPACDIEMTGVRELVKHYATLRIG